MAKFIGLDVGSKTIGIAVSEGYFAKTHSTINFTENNFLEASEKFNEFLKNNSYKK
nr:Holliday junction resolvase RuvX [Spiroplasma clarkii]